MKQPHKNAELIKAWADGAEIEYWNDYRNAWLDICAYPDWMTTTKYRIKPEPKQDVVVVRHVFTNVCGDFYTNCIDKPNVRFVFDCETGKLKKAEVLK